MASVAENLVMWDEAYDWAQGGDEWSSRWGGTCTQWYGMILPRIRSFLPADTILEIAPGFGRWTVFLKELCSRLIVVDLSAKCIEACRQRFAGCSHIACHVNDGRSLDMVDDESVDFVFCFDSLVHAEDGVMEAYAAHLARKLKTDGVAFLHHSNVGAYRRLYWIQRKLLRSSRLLRVLSRCGLMDNVVSLGRDPTMTAEKMSAYADEHGLQVISQEEITWNLKRTLVDCISILVKRNSIWARNNRVLKNYSFASEADHLSRLSELYDIRPTRR
jgi:SAM-dependent methyltransferase